MMSWSIGRPTALIVEGLARGVAEWIRPITDRAMKLTETPQSETPPQNGRAQALSKASDALKLRPEVEKPLLDAGMPPEGSSIYDGRKRAADTPEGATRKFVMWARAVGATGAFSVRTISALYWECAEVDHREPVAIDRFLRALKNAHGIRHEPSKDDRRVRVWIIEPAQIKRIPRAQAAVAAKVVANPNEFQPSVLQRFAPEQDYSSPQLLRATAHDARRQGRARKQRGSRNVRWAA
jgi:hypothetical protein